MKTQNISGNTYNSPEQNVAVEAKVVTAFSISQAVFPLVAQITS